MTRTKGAVARESLAHFRCGKCRKWWSVGDAPERKTWFCPWCGTKQEMMKEKSR